MVDLIVRFLSTHKRVSLKGIGSFSVEHLPARLDFPNRLLHAPETILHYAAEAEEDAAFDQWLVQELRQSTDEIKTLRQNFTEEFKRILNSKNEVEFTGLGRFEKDGNQLIHFTSAFETIVGMPVVAEKIIRKNTSHSIRVGEEEKTNVEMEELLLRKYRKPLNLWWLIAIALFVSALVAILLFATNHSQQWGKQGNEQKMTPNEAPALYKMQ
ncbi:hypothetical protein [Lacibacter sp. H407]|uniref:hypothetical protein n=1 Tax=Lacibacter sp. H407 TaxID=3133423 RepID=UPI0030C5E452